MVLSDSNKYLFVELPFSASTAISSELCKYYSGEKILRKHAYFHEFEKIASVEQKKYYVFSCIRNPLDVVVSLYFKYKSNHKNRFTTPSEWRRNGGTLSDKELKIFKYIHDNNANFKEYFYKYYKIPYDNWSSLAHHKFNRIIKFESIQSDFSNVLDDLDLEKSRDIPIVNKTNTKEGDFSKFYSSDMYSDVAYIFGPFMERWGYDFPENWKIQKIPKRAILEFRLWGIVRLLYWKYIRNIRYKK